MYYWVGVTESVKSWIQACSVCRSRTPAEPAAAPVRFCLAYGCDASSYVYPALSFHRSVSRPLPDVASSSCSNTTYGQIRSRAEEELPGAPSLLSSPGNLPWPPLFSPPTGSRRRRSSGAAGWRRLRGTKAPCAPTPASAPGTLSRPASRRARRRALGGGRLWRRTPCPPSCWRRCRRTR